MKKLKNIFVLLALSLAVFAVSALPAAAFHGDYHMDHDHDHDDGRCYGEHISSHAKMGHLGKDMNPGNHHRGFSLWAED